MLYCIRTTALFVTTACGPRPVHKANDVQSPPSLHEPSVAIGANRECQAHVIQQHRIGRRWDPDEHAGIDFSLCESQTIISIGDGVITYVDVGDESSRGGTLTILHTVMSPNNVRFYRYVHLSNIRVSKGDRVSRGQSLADPWEPVEVELSKSWLKHVHLEDASDSKRSPLQYIVGCHSVTETGKLVYPVSC